MDSRIREALREIVESASSSCEKNGKTHYYEDGNGELLFMVSADAIHEGKCALLSSPAEEAQDGEDDEALDCAAQILHATAEYWEVQRGAGLIQAYAARVARPMPDLTGEISTVRGRLRDHGAYYYVKDAIEALNRIEQAVKGPQPIEHPRRFESRTPGTTEVGGCDGSACFACPNPCDEFIGIIR